MARNKLTTKAVEKLTKPGIYSDGENLYLRISKNGGKRWVFIYKRPGAGSRTEMGLGSASIVSLAHARQKAEAARQHLAEGRDPRAATAKVASVPTFGELARSYFETHCATWRSEKHRQQWISSLETYAKPIWDMQVDVIEKRDVLAVLNPIWLSIPETASRVRNRIECVLDAAAAADHRSGENPARWRGNLSHLLPARPKIATKHHAAMPINEVPAFIQRLRDREAISARCLEFLILTAARAGEALGARWSEIDLDAATWTIPAERMKAGRVHRVPLSDRAVEILREMELLRDGEFVFPGQRRGLPLSDVAFTRLLDRMGETGFTVHGFRTALRGFCFKRGASWDVAELALAHVVGSATERAYWREDALEERRPFMQSWADHCAGRTSNVVPFRRSG